MTSSDDKIATISADGTITGVGADMVTTKVVNDVDERSIPLKVENENASDAENVSRFPCIN